MVSRLPTGARSRKLGSRSSKPVGRVKKGAIGQAETGGAKYKLGRVLYFGKKSRPKTIVVMFHGQGDNAKGCATDWADVWAAGLPGALVIVPEASDRTLWDEGKAMQKDKIGRDWLRQHGSHDWRDQEVSIRKIQRVVKKRMRHLNDWFDDLLRKYNLTNSDVIVTGFSQGTNVACLIGARRGVKSVLLCGGPGTESVFSADAKPDNFVGRNVWPRWEELMPKVAPGTKFFALEGTKDYSVPRKRLTAMLKKYDTTFRWEEGLQHHQLFSKRFRGIMLRRMQEDCSLVG
mmetsp:Transcript_18390/g.50479  ORF Transcript_18390/g.50479 Transcript_18390/m.50479 type:complete len:289 (-) Transcript_18390:153-1019(-)